MNHQVSLEGPQTKNRILNTELAENIRHLMPMRLQVSSKWEQAYSLEGNGASLRTLYDQVRPKTKYQHGYVLLLRDSLGGVFGAYSNTPFKAETGGHFYGNADCFLFKATGDRFEAFPYTGENDFVIFSTPKFLSFGGGDGHYSLWMDDNLDKGVSYRTPTFGNEVLSAEGSKFHIVAVEVWRV